MCEHVLWSLSNAIAHCSLRKDLQVTFLHFVGCWSNMALYANRPIYKNSSYLIRTAANMLGMQGEDI